MGMATRPAAQEVSKVVYDRAKQLSCSRLQLPKS